jgi:hypothetical protein
MDGEYRILFVDQTARRLLGGQPESLSDLEPDLQAAVSKGGSHLLRRGDRILKATTIKGESSHRVGTRIRVLVQDFTEDYALLRDLARTGRDGSGQEDPRGG